MQKYFSWGDTIGKNKNGKGSYLFSQANWNAGKCGKGHNLTGDIPQGNARYDAATANMGSPFKMPNLTQCQELINGTNSTWTTINGVNGGKLISKTDSSKYIFLPAGGNWDETDHDGTEIYNYSWTTKLKTATAYGTSADVLFFYQYSTCNIQQLYCHYSISIRPVK